MEYDPDVAVYNYKYTPLHSNQGIAATLAIMNLETAMNHLPDFSSCSIFRANLVHGHTHIIQCILRGCITPTTSSFTCSPPAPNAIRVPQTLLPCLHLRNGSHYAPKQSFISRTGEAAIRTWVYTPKHSNPVAAFNLAYMNMVAASQVVGFSLCEEIEEMERIHVRECILKENERVEKQK